MTSDRAGHVSQVEIGLRIGVGVVMTKAINETRRMRWSIVAIFVVLFPAQGGWAITLTMDEVVNQPVNGLSLQGVTFGFQIGGQDSTDAAYNALGPGETTFVQDPSIEGATAGVLTLDFSVATSQLQFGVAVNATGDLSPGFTVELFNDALSSLGTHAVNTSPMDSMFSEGQYSHSGDPVRRAVINFSQESDRFAIDNLMFVPEPSAVTLFLSALCCLARRQRALPGNRSDSISSVVNAP